jgi:hypothetical protein
MLRSVAERNFDTENHSHKRRECEFDHRLGNIANAQIVSDLNIRLGSQIALT